MSEPTIQPDDPRLTAYALGELDEAERLEVEQLLEHSPDSQTEVAAIRQTAELLGAELAGEPITTLTADQRAAIEQAAARSHQAPKPSRRWPRRLVIAIAGLTTVAAGLFALVHFQGSASVRYFGSSAKQFEDPGSVYVLRDEVQYYDEAPDAQSGTVEDLERLRAFSYVDDGVGRTMPSQQLAGLDDALSVSEVLAQEQRLLNGRHSIVPPAPIQEHAPGSDAESGESVSSLLGSRLAGAQVEWALPQRRTRSYARGSVAAGTVVDDGVPTMVAGRGISTTPRPQTTEELERRQVTNAPPATRAPKDAESWQNLELHLPNLDSWPETTEIRLSVSGVVNPNLDVAFQQGSFDIVGTEAYNPIVENDFLSPQQQPLSTFSIDVDTGAYSNVRRFLTQGQMPPPNAVRIEELINYFGYDDPAPDDGQPFSVRMETGACPWQPKHQLLRVGLKGKAIPREERPPSNLVFLLDVSGSMRDATKLPLVKMAMELLVSEMTEDDRIAIVTYAGNAGLALDSMSGAHRDEILSTIGNLQAGGSTNGEAGIRLAYDKAVEHFIEDGANRVILCTDGDFNVGMSDDNALVAMIKQKARSGVFLSVFGFGMGNLKDGKLEQLADKGNGQYGYIDNFREARKVFFEELTGTLYTIAKDVKIQIEFNPSQVGAYRLIGYENRVMAAQDFHDDTKDAGEIGAGHSVTALYEIVPAGQAASGKGQGGLKYQQVASPQPAPADEAASDEWLTLSLRYKQPDGKQSVLKKYPLEPGSTPADEASPGRQQRSRDYHWTAAVAAFGMILRNSAHRGQADYDMVLELATGSLGSDATGDRQEFVDLVRAAQSIRP